MSDILAEILANKRVEVERVRASAPLERVQEAAAARPACRDFLGAVAVRRGGAPNLIAEIKRRSPSAGEIRADFDPASIARAYAGAGAAAISVLTDERYFDGRLAYIDVVRGASPLPVLRKDFIVDAYQVYESRAAGADAILLIGEALEERQLGEFFAAARALGLGVLVEVHDEPHLERVLRAIPELAARGGALGVNNRDLKTQRVDLGTTERLAARVPPGTPMVAESGVRTQADVRRLAAAGATAMLVGESLMGAPDIGAAVRELLSPG